MKYSSTILRQTNKHRVNISGTKARHAVTIKTNNTRSLAAVRNHPKSTSLHEVEHPFETPCARMALNRKTF